MQVLCPILHKKFVLTHFILLTQMVLAANSRGSLPFDTFLGLICMKDFLYLFFISNLLSWAVYYEGQTSEDRDVICSSSRITKDTPLFLASCKGDLKRVQMLLKEGANINQKNTYNITSLQVAIIQNQYHVASYLVDQGASTDMQNDDGETAFSYVIDHGDGTLFNKLIKLNPNVLTFNSLGDTPFIKAVKKNRHQFIEPLLNLGADINQLTKNGFSALHIAVSKQYPEMVQLLIKKGIDTLLPVLNSRNTALHMAVIRQDYNICMTLLRGGADPLILNKKMHSPLDLARASGIASIIELFESALMPDSDFEDIPITPVKKSKKGKKSKTPPKFSPSSPLRQKAQSDSSPDDSSESSGSIPLSVNTSLEQVTLTRDDFISAIRGKDYLTLSTIMSSEVLSELDLKASPLFFAVHHGEYEVVAWFLTQGLDLNVRSPGGDHPTPFLMAALEGKMNLLPAFPDWKNRMKTDYTLPQNEGKNPRSVLDILFSIQKPNEDLAHHLSILIQAGLHLDEDPKDPSGNTILMQKVTEKCIGDPIVLERNRLTLIDQLVQGGASVHRQDVEGYTPILRAAQGQNLNLVLYLYAFLGANLQDKTPDMLEVESLLDEENRIFLNKFKIRHEQYLKTSSFSPEAWSSIKFTEPPSPDMECTIMRAPMNIPVTVNHGLHPMEYMALLKNCLINGWRNPMTNKSMTLDDIQLNKPLQHRILNLVQAEPLNLSQNKKLGLFKKQKRIEI